MTEQDFFAQLKELLVTDAYIEKETSLQELEEWDSVAFVLIIAFFDKHFGKHVTFAELAKCFCPGDLVALAGGAIA